MADIQDQYDNDDVESANALCMYYGTVAIKRSVEGRHRGYTVTLPNGCTVFQHRLGSALRTMLEALGHGDDREIMLFGEESQSSW